MVVAFQATPRDRDAVVRTVVAAFAGDPGWEFMMPGDSGGVMPAFAGALFDLRVESGDVWMTDGAHSVAMWVPPGGSPVDSTKANEVWRNYRNVAGEECWNRMVAYDDAIEAVRPLTPHWYLGVLATHPDHQGLGLARSVTAPVLDLADDAGLACCLETSKTGNKPFYAKLGFTEVTDVDLPGGPPTWWLRRPPSGG